MKPDKRVPDITDLWIDLIIDISAFDGGYICQLRKFVQGYTWTIPGDIWGKGNSFTMEDLGYNPRAKMTQLKRNYYNESGIAKANEKLRDRILGKKPKNQTSVAVNTINQEKDGRSQGHCMRSVIVTHFSKPVAGGDEFITLDIIYRSTELTKKFGADLIFLRELFVPELLRGLEHIAIKEVRMYFSNLFVSSMYMPIVYQRKDAVDILVVVKKYDPAFFKRVMMQTKTLLTNPHGHYSFRNRAEMHHLALRLVEEGVIDRDRFFDFIKNEISDSDMEEDDEGDDEE